MKAILIAAGLGTRLAPYTDEMPKCLMPVGQMSMLEHQIHAFRSSGIDDIVVVRGHMAEKFPDLGVTYVNNERYRQNNILNSLMCAREHMRDGFIASYSDLVYEPRMVSGLLSAPGEIVISIDDTWQQRYAGLEFHPPQAVEKVSYSNQGEIREVGKGISNQAPGEFIGLLRCDGAAAPEFLHRFDEAKALYWGKPFVRASDFEKAYLTDFLQYLIDCGIRLHGVVQSDVKWVEVDTEEDLKLANASFAG